MRIGIAAVLVGVAAVAEAKPLPRGMTVTFKKAAMYVTQDGVTVPLLDDESALAEQVANFTGAELSDDGSEPKQIGFAGNIVVFQFRQNAFIACDGDAQRSYSKVVRVQ